MDVTIVALPPVGDRTWKVSSEKVPHLTMLYLEGIAESDLPELLQFVAHASGNLDPFGLQVDYRDTLGDQDADVLFFETNAWDIKRVAQFRHQLLLNDIIRRGYDNAHQYPEWTPHLTLGYPESPAKEDDVEYPLRFVDFDRIAVWTGDYEGPEFRLKYDLYDHGAMEVAMSSTTTERGAAAVEELFHYGVKGMKWGVRREDRGRGKIRRGATKANVALDAGAKIINEGEKKLIFLPEKNRQDAASNTQMRMLGAARTVNKDPQFKGKDLKGNPELKKAYFNKLAEEAKTIYAEELRISRTEAWAEFLGMDVDSVSNQMRIEMAIDKMYHSAEDTETLLVMDFVTDENGFVTDIKVPAKYLRHMDDNEHTIVHYGVKGMRWGVRKDEQTSRGGADSGPTSVVVTQKKPGKYAKTSGGKGHPISDDARVALEARQKAKASTTDALSNVELRKAVERMNLEQQYQNLQYQSDRRSKGARFAAGLIGQKRYTGEKRRYRDFNEEFGEHTRTAGGAAASKVKAALEVGSSIKRTDLSNIA